MVSAVGSYRGAIAPRVAGFAPSAPVYPGTTPPAQPAPQGPVNTLPDPANPVAAILAAPINASLIVADLVQALSHPIKTIKSLWSLMGNLGKFDRLTPLQAASGPAARDSLHAAVADLKSSGLTHVLGFAARAIDRRAGVAFAQLRPSVEQTLGGRAGRPINLMWPAAGRNWTALDDTITIQNVLAQYPDAIVQKAFMGVSEIQVVDQSFQGYFQPVRRSGAALIVSRPLGLVPGEKRLDESLMAYLNEAGRVSANF
ncbi:MAG: hypothetical protein FJZ01_00515 [Candidatus Sericytochromatia bacterium]|nr:hypothetical protein [Candidatus Tanganyikabacteria bacterium]